MMLYCTKDFSSLLCGMSEQEFADAPLPVDICTTDTATHPQACQPLSELHLLGLLMS